MDGLVAHGVVDGSGTVLDALVLDGGAAGAVVGATTEVVARGVVVLDAAVVVGSTASTWSATPSWSARWSSTRVVVVGRRWMLVSDVVLVDVVGGGRRHGRWRDEGGGKSPMR